MNEKENGDNMKTPKLSCPNQEKKNKRVVNHPCKNCKYHDKSLFIIHGSTTRSCVHPDGAALFYPDDPDFLKRVRM